MNATTASTTKTTTELADRITGLARDTVYVLIGAGVLTVQQLQVRRRELAGGLGDNPVVKQLGIDGRQLDDLVERLEAGIGQLDARVETIEAKLDAAVEAIENRLPEQAGVLLGQAHDVAKAARKQVRGLIRNAA